MTAVCYSSSQFFVENSNLSLTLILDGVAGTVVFHDLRSCPRTLSCKKHQWEWGKWQWIQNTRTRAFLFALTADCFHCLSWKSFQKSTKKMLFKNVKIRTLLFSNYINFLFSNGITVKYQNTDPFIERRICICKYFVHQIEYLIARFPWLLLFCIALQVLVAGW